MITHAFPSQTPGKQIFSEGQKAVLESSGLLFLFLKCGRQADKDRDIFRPLIHSLNSCNSWGWVRLKPGAWTIIQVSHRMVETQLLKSSPVCTSAGSWNHNWSQNLNPGTLLREVGVPGSIFTAGPITLPWLLNKKWSPCTLWICHPQHVTLVS